MTPQETAAEVRYLTCADVATIIRVEPAVVADYCRSGKLPATRPAKAWLIKSTDLDAWLAEHSNQPTEGVA